MPRSRCASAMERAPACYRSPTKPPVRCWRWRLFPLYRWAHVTIGAVQAVFRGLFERWGRPQRLRVGNGAPGGPGDDLPSPLLLWLIGLGIAAVYNPPGRPTGDAKGGRNNGTVDRGAGP